MKKSIAEWIKDLKIQAASLTLQIENAKEPENEDWETDQDMALSGLEVLVKLPEPPPEIGCLIVELTPKRWERHVDNAREIGEDLYTICGAVAEAGFEETDYAEALYEPCNSFNNIV